MDLRHRLKSALGAGCALERELESDDLLRVFLATDISLQRRVVVKVLPSELTGAVSTERFRSAIRPATRLQHPYIVSPLAAGDIDGRLYCITPFVPGEPLRARLTRAGELPIADALRLLSEVSAALAHAHEHGLGHGHLGPHTVLLAGGNACVTDFGVGAALSAARVERGNGPAWRDLTLGPPAYRAPEESAGAPADFYAFGCLGYEILSGQAPFPGRSAAALLVAHAVEAPEPIERRRAGVPPGLAALLMACLAKRPADRPGSAAEIARELESIGAGRTTGAHQA